ncbi:hypothetical protein SERLADRAFT_404519 [Serpula lacrymans var. lacrymans S7.9]|nr:uncharacterized protein SERLADRAFT_404519 [Serpula lacrymans var. lacrymans S7.9]EGO30271.1 hypothetical protein SERLADRAFT_404519 [Serpula lacrymans var. lacrymans S7.9]
MLERGEALDIDALQITKEASMGDVQLELTAREATEGHAIESVAWLISRFNLEDVQDALRVELWQLPLDATVSQKTDIEAKKQCFMARIIAFHQKTNAVLAGIELDDDKVPQELVDDPRLVEKEGNTAEEGWEDLDTASENINIDEEETPIQAEYKGIWIPFC